MTDWDALTEAFLHDPPDKALDVQGHVRRAKRYLDATGLTASAEQGRHDDALAAVAERLPLPDGRRRPQGWDGIAVSPDAARRLRAVHPLSGVPREIQVPSLDEAGIADAIREVVGGRGGRERFLALWRSLPDTLARLHPAYANLPADTRIPDHTLWHHADITAAFQATLPGGGPAFLTVAIGPVQGFIATARTLRDLWSGSFLLSRLAFQGLLPIVEALGPQCLVFPHLRGNPQLDHWLRETAGLDLAPSDDILVAPCLPNKFLALVPAEQAEALAQACDRAIRQAWRGLTARVHGLVEKQAGRGFAAWDLAWEAQVEGFFEIRTAVVPWRIEDKAVDDQVIKLLAGCGKQFGDAFPDATKIRDLAAVLPESDRPGYDQRQAGRWQMFVAYAARLLDAAKAVRHVPPHAGPADTRPKCDLLGTLEAMGPASSRFDAFWEEAARSVKADGVHLRQEERLCAISLVKRFAPAFIRRDLGVSREVVRFDDTATIAAAAWLQDHPEIDPLRIRREHGDWSGQWLHWPAQDSEAEDGEARIPDPVWKAIREARAKKVAPTYLAVLHLDGDHMGRWLRGENSPRVKDVVHPTLVRYFEGLPDRQAVATALDARRPVGPALHAAVSTALAHFALHAVPGIVAEAHGELIYAGGDDVVALLPPGGALACARALARAFSGNPEDGCFHRGDGKAFPVMGPSATVSAGLAVVHYKDDLRDGLEAARAAERAAKSAGRNALGLSVRRRSGEHALAVAPWDLVDGFDGLRVAFLDDASDRWAYKLRQEAPVLGSLPYEAMEAEIGRLLKRTEPKTRERIGDAVLAAWPRYHDWARKRQDGPAVLEDFAILVQSASFLARGRDA